MQLKYALPLLGLLSTLAIAEDDLATALKKIQSGETVTDPAAPNPFAKKAAAVPQPPSRRTSDGWLVSTSLQFSDSKFDLPANPYHATGTTANVTLVKPLDDTTFLGLGFSYNLSETSIGVNAGESKTNTPSGSVFLMRNLGNGWLADGSLGYGQVLLDSSYTSGSRISYRANSSFWSGSVGLTKIIPLSSTLNAEASARYIHTDSGSDSYVDSAGARTGATQQAMDIVSFGGALNWRLGAWEPYARLNWSSANRELAAGTGDRDYFDYALGVGYVLSPKTKLGLGYTGSVDRAYTTDQSLSLSVSTQF